MPRLFDTLIISCEHAGNRVPARWRPLFHGQGARAALDSHRGIDFGALALGRHLARSTRAPLFANTITRLLVETNRSIGHPRLFSTFARGLDERQRRAVLAACYTPHRERIAGAIAARLSRNQRVLHLGVHSFTPVLRGRRRLADIGLLYDPARPREAALCSRWRAIVNDLDPRLVVRRNYPYRGASDGLTTSFRERFGSRYLGIEIEVNHKRLRPGAGPADIHRVITASLARLAR